MYQRQIFLQQVSIKIKQQRQILPTSQTKVKTKREFYMEAAIPTKEGILQALDEVFQSVRSADAKLHDRWRNNIMDTLERQNWRSLLKENFFLIHKELVQKSDTLRKDCLKKFDSRVKLLIKNNQQCPINQTQIGARENDLSRRLTRDFPMQGNYNPRLKTQVYQKQERKSSTYIRKSNIVQNPQFELSNRNISKKNQVYINKQVFEPSHTEEYEKLVEQNKRITKKLSEYSDNIQSLEIVLKAVTKRLRQKEKQMENLSSSQKIEKLNEQDNQEKMKNQMLRRLNSGYLKKQIPTQNILEHSKKPHQQLVRKVVVRKAEAFDWQEQSD